MTAHRKPTPASPPSEQPGPRTAAEQPIKRRRQTPYPHLFRLLHWVLPVCLAMAAWTGLGLHAMSPPGWSWFSGGVPGWLSGWRFHVIHLSVAVVFVPSLVAVLWMYCRRKVPRRMTHLLLLGGGLAMVASGLLLLNPLGPSWIWWAARGVHVVSGIVVLPVALTWHVVEGLGRFRRVLVAAFDPWASPRWRQSAFFLPLLLASACLILSVLPSPPARRKLVARRVEQTAGPLEGLPWDEAAPLEIQLAGGIGFDGGRTPVTLRALHDGKELFLRAEWLDPVEDRRYVPWERTADGWRQLSTNLADENVYYEDKFSVVFPTQADWQFERFGCAVYCHAGGGRPDGYKGSRQIVDVWHWKAVRTDPVNQVDDKYWQGFDLSAKNVGRHGDPRDGGGYDKNISGDGTHPDYLPDDSSAVTKGAIPRAHRIKYSSEAAARISPGTIVPGAVVSPFRGDRGDVGCTSQYDGGRWRLFVRRKLDTGHRYDVRFVPGRSHPFACAAFDHSSNRHAHGHSVYHLELEE